jgi:hypothetical protein
VQQPAAAAVQPHVTVYQVNSRTIQYPDGSKHDFDVCVKRQPSSAAAVDQAAACGLFVCVLPYFSADASVILIR